MSTSLLQLAGRTDIYLIDQILKGRYGTSTRVLDAGCGEGRNLHWFLAAQIDAYGGDNDAAAIDLLRSRYPHLPADRFRVEAVESMSFANETFDHVISSAVLHFAQGPAHFWAMLHEMLRVLKTGGSIFIRMATDIGIENKVQPIGNGRYDLPDGSTRFLLTRELLAQMQQQLPLRLLEPFKSVNVADQRCMCVLVLEKLPASP